MVTPRGTVYDVPEGWKHSVQNNNKGSNYQEPNSSGNENLIRIAEPNSLYPDGYARVYSKHGQPVDLWGKPGPNAATHIPETYRGDWPSWPEG